MKSGKFNFLEPSGPLQACNGTALPYELHVSGNGVSHQAGHEYIKIWKYARTAAVVVMNLETC